MKTGETLRTRIEKEGLLRGMDFWANKPREEIVIAGLKGELKSSLLKYQQDAVDDAITRGLLK